MPKLTKEIIDNLIQEAIIEQEDALGAKKVTDITADAAPTGADDILRILRDTFGRLLSDDEIESIAGLSENKLSEDTGALEVGDLEKLFSKDEREPTDEELFNKVNQSLIAFINKVKDPDRARQLANAKKLYDDAIMKIQGLAPSVEPEYSTLRRSIMPATAGGDPSERAPVDPAMFQSFEGFFDGVDDDLKSRVDYLSKFCSAVANAADGTNDAFKGFTAAQIILGGNLMSTISAITRQVDPQAGGLMAEAFLAFLVGGSKIGQAGGAADFVGAGGKKYSSKWGPTGAQSINNFTTAGEVITYIAVNKIGESDAPAGGVNILELALKIYDVKTTVPFKPAVTKYGSDEPKKYANSWLYYSTTTPTIEVGGESGETRTGATMGYYGTVKKLSSKAIRKPAPKKNDVLRIYDSEDQAKAALEADNPPGAGKFNVAPPASLKGIPFKMVTASSQVFDQIFSDAVSGSANELVKAVTKLYAQTKSIEDNSTSYVASGDFSDAVALADQYTALKDSIRVMITKKSDTSAATSLGLSENKQKKFQDLDKMIEELMLEHLQGDTDDNN